MAFNNFAPPSSAVQKWSYPTIAPQALTLQPMEALRAHLAALGLGPGAINAGQTSLVGNYNPAETPAGGVQFQLRNYRGPPAQFSAGGKGHRPLMPGQMGLAPTPMQAYGSAIPRPAAPRPITLPPFRPMPGGNLNPYNIKQFKARGIDPFGPKAYRRR
jgi:hypothetical protein